MAYIPERRTPDPELRLLALYALDKLGPCTDLDLLQFLFELDLMNYFELMLSLSDLCRQGHAVRVEQEAAWRYEITQAGRDVLSMFESRIPGSKRDLVDTHAPEWKEKIVRQRHCGVEVRQTRRGEYEAQMTLADHDMQLMRLTLTLPSGDMAREMTEKWEKRAGDVYTAVLSLLRDKEE
jgi:hypothetical protein